MHLFAIVILLVIAGAQIDARNPFRATPRRPIQVVPPRRPAARPPPRNTRPCVCRPINDPVCGTNGETYANDCELKCAQKRIDAIKLDCEGRCPCQCDCNSGKSKSKKCEEECTARTSNVCLQPMVTGPCEARLRRWFHNNQTKQCEQFGYSGCQGNGNRFESKEQCEKTCVKPPSDDPCKLPKDGGPCKAALRRWYYDTKEADCTFFPYGGCGGNANNFQSRKQCQDKCKVVQ